MGGQSDYRAEAKQQRRNGLGRPYADERRGKPKVLCQGNGRRVTIIPPKHGVHNGNISDRSELFWGCQARPLEKLKFLRK